MEEDGPHAISPGVWRLTWRVARGWHCKVPAIQIRVIAVCRGHQGGRMPPAHDFNLHTHVKYFWQSQLTQGSGAGGKKSMEIGSHEIGGKTNITSACMTPSQSVITSRFAVNIELPCKILDFQRTAPRAALCCYDSDWHPGKMSGQGKHFDARCWTAALEISGVYEVTSANGIDSAKK